MIALDTIPRFFVCRVQHVLGFILLLAVLHAAGIARAGEPGRVPGARLPLRFAVNAGQWEEGVLFGAIRGMDKVAFAREGVFLFRPMEHRGTPRLSDVPTWDAGKRELQVSGLRFVRASANMRVEGFDEAATRSHFYSGADSARWRGDVPTYRGVRYREVWPGVDVEYVEREGRLLQRIVLSAGADAERVAIVAGNLGGNALSGIEAEGRLYRRGDTLRVKPQRNTFELRQVIETEVNTYFGGSGADEMMSMVLARDDAVLLYMLSTSTDLPLRTALQGTHRGGPFNIDAYVACLEVDMRELRFATYLGGSGDDPASPVRYFGVAPRIAGKLICYTCTDDIVLLNNPQSLDFPITSNALQFDRYTSPHPLRRNGAAVLVALTANGMLRTSTWLGGPRWFGAYLLDFGPDGSVYVAGTASGRQWFVRPGGLQDTIRNGAGCDDGITPLLVLARLSPALDSVRNATYFFAPDGIMDTLEVPNFDYLGMNVDRAGNVVLTGNWGGAYLPVINAWITVGNRWDRYIAKFDPTLSQLRFCSHLPQRVPTFSSMDFGEALTTDRWNNIWLLSTLETLAEDTIPIIGPYGKLIGQNILYKFRPDGGVPEFSFHLPWNREEIKVNTASILSDSCGRILFFGTTSAPDDSLLDNPFTGPVPGTLTHFIAAMDPASAAVEYCGYFHTDSSYSGTYEHDPPMPVIVRHTSGFALLNVGGCVVDKSGNLVLAGVVGPGGSNIITPLRAFQSVAGGGTDGYLIRTRVPGCELLGCAIAMPTLLTVGDMPPVRTPEYFPVSVTLRNNDPARGVRDVECQITLRAGLLLDPPTQSARQSLGARVLAPGESATLIWTVRVDSARLPADGVWVDAICTYRSAVDTHSGTPASTHCEEYLHIVRENNPDPALRCALLAPDTLGVNIPGDDYAPAPLPVRFELLNTGDTPLTISSVELLTGGGMRAAPQAGTARQPGGTVAPGGTLVAQWNVTVDRLGDARLIQLLAIGRDGAGNAVSWCAREMLAPALDPLRCASGTPPTITWDGNGGVMEPADPRATFTVRQVLDTVVAPVYAELDTTACRRVGLAAGENALHTLHALPVGVNANPEWRLALRSAPTEAGEDTLRLLLRARDGAWTRECAMIVPVRLRNQGADCALVAPDSLSVGEIEAGVEVQSTYTLRNTGTIPLEVARVELALPPDAGLLPLDALTQPGGTLAPGGDITRQWRLRPLALRAERSPRLVVTAYNAEDSVLARCEHTLRLPGVEGLRCALELPDSVRFDRGTLAYVPDPVPLSVVLRNPLDGEETAVVAEVDLAAAPRLELAAGEPALRNLARVDSNATARLDWLLHALPGDADEPQRVRVRYRSAGHAEWKYCEEDLLVTAWPREIAVLCATGGHDTLHADAAYERLIPEPFEVSYALRNTGTIALRDVRARIVLPAEFELASSSEEQSYGDLAPGAEALRWWSLRTTTALGGYGPFALRWRWWSEEQAESDGCAHSIGIDPEAPRGVVFTPLHLHFEAERDKALPPAQGVRLWTGGGLSMPWTLRAGAWWIAGDPSTGDHTTDIAVQPVSTALDFGLHTSGIEVTGHATNHPADIAVTYRITGVASGTRTPVPVGIALGAVWPQPLRGAGRVEIFSNTEDSEGFANTENTEGFVHLEKGRVTLRVYDMLGRERALLFDGPLNARSVLVTITPTTLGLEPGSYMLRLTGGAVFAVRRFSVVR